VLCGVVAREQIYFGGVEERRRDPRCVSRIRLDGRISKAITFSSGDWEQDGRVIHQRSSSSTLLLPRPLSLQSNGRLLTATMAPKFKDGEIVASVSVALAFTRRMELTRCSSMANGYHGHTQSSPTVCAHISLSVKCIHR
jgi:hypothetical protein